MVDEHVIELSELNHRHDQDQAGIFLVHRTAGHVMHGQVLQDQSFDYRWHVAGCQQAPARAAGNFQVLDGHIGRIDQLEGRLLPGAINDG